MSVSRATPSELGALWRLALPLALAQAGQALMGLVDTAVLGRLSAAAQAGLGNSLVFTCTFFGMGVMMALDPLVSQAIGAGDVTRARTHFWQGVWLALLTSAVVMVPVALLPFILEPFGVRPLVAEGAREYMWWRLPGVAAVLLFVTARSYLTGTGRVAIECPCLSSTTRASSSPRVRASSALPSSCLSLVVDGPPEVAVVAITGAAHLASVGKFSEPMSVTRRAASRFRPR